MKLPKLTPRFTNAEGGTALRRAKAVPATVERAKALKAEGMTLRQVAERLSEEGHKTRAGTPYQYTRSAHDLRADSVA